MRPSFPPTLITTGLSRALYGIAATRALEQRTQAQLPAHTLMQRAGLATARLALALAPHAQRIWIACGPGNNGGDGFEAALQLHQLGKSVTLTWTGSDRMPEDARASQARAKAAGLAVSPEPPADPDFCMDALLGLGGRLGEPGVAQRPAAQQIAQWLTRMDAIGAPVLSVDLPSGLDADTGAMPHGLGPAPSPPLNLPNSPGARHTLSLLTLKPGLFTAHGRDRAGQVWFDDLGIDIPDDIGPLARLLGSDEARRGARHLAAHSSHKGSFGDVAVLGGETLRAAPSASMGGAALLAARAALHAGAGRVFVALLGQSDMLLDALQPELMFRSPAALDMKQQVMVCGCGGGASVAALLPELLANAPRAVLDADALNAIAADAGLQNGLRQRASRNFRTVLTPHPLEAARLLGCSASQVQAHRLDAAQQLTLQFGCVVVLKGSGTVVAAPDKTPWINASGNALLATAGTGDVLAGMIGAGLARGDDAWHAAAHAVFVHGAVADSWQQGAGGAFTASVLARGGVSMSA